MQNKYECSPRSGRQPCRLLRRLGPLFTNGPGAHAPGFMLAPASRAKSLFLLSVRFSLFGPKDPLRAVLMLLARRKESALFEPSPGAALHVCI